MGNHFEGYTLLLLAIFSSQVRHLCLSDYEFNVGQGQALKSLFLSVTGVKGYLSGSEVTRGLK